MPETSREQTLGDLASGACGLVRAVEAGPFDAERLKAMGLCEGRRVTVLKSGQPMIVSVLGTRLGLDRHLARFVTLDPADQTEQCCIEAHEPGKSGSQE